MCFTLYLACDFCATRRSSDSPLQPSCSLCLCRFWKLGSLGPPELRLGGEPLILRPRNSAKAKAVLFYLAAAGASVARERLAGLLWSDWPEKKAHDYFRGEIFLLAPFRDTYWLELGVAAGITTLLVVAVSFFIPWWHLTVGEDLLQVNASPVNTNFSLFILQFTVPLILAFNLISVLTFVASGAVMLLYSFIPTKSYANHLLGFSYKKPLYILVIFVLGLIVMVSIAGVLGLSIPLMGTANVSLPSSLLMGTNVSVSVSASFLLPFWMAIVAVILCVAARVYHRHAFALKPNPVAPLQTAQDLPPSAPPI